MLAVFSLAWLLKLMIGSASRSVALGDLTPAPRILHASDVLLPAVLPAVRHSVSRGDVAVQRVLRQAGPRNRQAGAWGVADEQLDQVKSFGVKKFEDFTWKHMLDFYSCADCGRCSDNCPANAVGRPLSPRFLSIKARDYAFQHFPVFGKRGQRPRADRWHLLRRRNLVVHHLRRSAKKSVRC